MILGILLFQYILYYTLFNTTGPAIVLSMLLSHSFWR